ncbi:MAG: hypothetical protein IPK79_14265 [Vampirovibrionales bacterium]|nr:hypothetical protein [Vampirovibrionales bacterium]
MAVEFGNARFAWNTALFARQQARLLHGRVDLGERVNRKTGEVRWSRIPEGTPKMATVNWRDSHCCFN